MKYLLFALVIIFPLGQLGRAFYLNDFAVFFVVVAWFITTRKNITADPLFKPLMIWFSAMIVSTLVNPIKIPALLYLVRFVVYSGLYFVAKDQIKEKQTLVKLLKFAVLAVAGIGLLQFVFLPDVSFLKAFDWDDHYYRLISTFLDPGFTGAILVLGLILFLHSHLSFLVLIYLALALTYSRASYLMLVASSAILSRKLLVVVIAAFLITIPLLPKSTGEGTKLERESSITARINNWSKTLEVWEKNPVFGIGFNTYRFEAKVAPKSHSGGADSSLLLVLATTGILGFAAYIYLLKKTWDLGDFVFKASLAGIIIHSFFNNTLFYPHVMEWLWIILALRPKAHTSD